MGQEQNSGSESVNVQAGRDVTIAYGGISYTEARQIALDVYKNSAAELANIAKTKEQRLVEEITDRFLQKLSERNPGGVNQAIRPDFQLALLDAQKAYARTGDEEMGRVLVDLLVARTQERARTLREIVLTESLSVVPRLTTQQINTIAVVFILRYTKNFSITSLDRLAPWFDQVLKPFLPDLTEEGTFYQHLVYSGAATLEMTRLSLGRIFGDTYPGLFCVGQPRQHYQPLLARCPALESVLVPALHNGENLQLPPLTHEKITELLTKRGIPNDIQSEAWQKHLDGRKSEGDVEGTLAAVIPDLLRLQEVWIGSPIANMQLTSVGMAIGHGQFVNLTGDKAPLSIWIPS